MPFSINLTPDNPHVKIPFTVVSNGVSKEFTITCSKAELKALLENYGVIIREFFAGDESILDSAFTPIVEKSFGKDAHEFFQDFNGEQKILLLCNIHDSLRALALVGFLDDKEQALYQALYDKEQALYEELGVGE